MEDATKKIDKLFKKEFSSEEIVFFHEVLSSWHKCISWLRVEDDAERLFDALAYEIQNGRRPAILDRIRSRFNKVRAYQELKALEAKIGLVININYV